MMAANNQTSVAARRQRTTASAKGREKDQERPCDDQGSLSVGMCARLLRLRGRSSVNKKDVSGHDPPKRSPHVIVNYRNELQTMRKADVQEASLQLSDLDA